MKTAVIPISVAFEVASAVAFAQGAADPMAQLRACALMERSERSKCLEELSRSVRPAPDPAREAPTGAPAREAEDWIVSETTSPVDYTPIVTAKTVPPAGANSASLQLMIRCKGDRTELVMTGPDISRNGAEYAISYRINGNQPVQLAAASPSLGAGAAFPGDVVRLLQSLPAEGDLAVRISARAADAHEGHFSLAGLKAVRDRIARACKWPNAVGAQRQ